MQAGVPLLFWTLANEVTPISQAKRFYPLFAILGNLGPIASGQTMAYVSRNRPAGMDAEMAFERTLKVGAAYVCVWGGVGVLVGLVFMVGCSHFVGGPVNAVYRRSSPSLNPAPTLMCQFFASAAAAAVPACVLDFYRDVL